MDDPFKFTWKPRVGKMWPAIGLTARVLLKPSPGDQIISMFHPSTWSSVLQPERPTVPSRDLPKLKIT